jgi:hypothetical protein
MSTGGGGGGGGGKLGFLVFGGAVAVGVDLCVFND